MDETSNNQQSTPTGSDPNIDNINPSEPVETPEQTTTIEATETQETTPPEATTETEAPATPEAPTQAEETSTTPEAPALDITPKKKTPPVGLIVGLAIGAVALVGIIVCCVIALMGGKVDYEATYDALEPLDAKLDDIAYGDCYKINSDIDDENITSEKFQEYISGCVEEFVALETASNDFGKTSGVKHDENIKKAYEDYQTALKAVYTKKTDLEAQLAYYLAYHDFVSTIVNSDTDVKSLKKAIDDATKIFEDTGNAELKTFAQGFHERGLAYIQAIDDYQNSSSYSSSLYSNLYDKMEEFTDYLEEVPEIADVSGLDFTKMNDLGDAYDKLAKAVRDAYYEHQ